MNILAIVTVNIFAIKLEDFMLTGNVEQANSMVLITYFCVFAFIFLRICIHHLRIRYIYVL